MKWKHWTEHVRAGLDPSSSISRRLTARDAVTESVRRALHARRYRPSAPFHHETLILLASFLYDIVILSMKSAF